MVVVVVVVGPGGVTGYRKARGLAAGCGTCTSLPHELRHTDLQ